MFIFTFQQSPTHCEEIFGCFSHVKEGFRAIKSTERSPKPILNIYNEKGIKVGWAFADSEGVYRSPKKLAYWYLYVAQYLSDTPASRKPYLSQAKDILYNLKKLGRIKHAAF